VADVRPFRGLRYGLDQVDLGNALAPPYDVIDAPAQQALHARSPFNVIRLEYPFEEGEASTSQRRDALTLLEWLAHGVLRRDPVPAFYLHEQRFSLLGEERSRLGLIAAVRLHAPEERVILPHEHTTPKPVEDRLSALRAIQTNVSPIFGLFRDRNGEAASAARAATQAPPLVEAMCEGETHRLWAIADTAQQQALQRLFEGRVVYLADGHHRFQAARAYRDECAARQSPRGAEARAADLRDRAWQFVLMHLVALEDPGLVVLPLHRLLRGLNTEAQGALDEALGAFLVEPLPLPDDAEFAARTIIAALAAKVAAGPAYCLLRLGSEALMLAPKAPREGGSAHLRPTLDVVLLHRLLIDRLVDSPQAATDRGDLAYTPWAVEALQQVRSGAYQVALFQNPVPVSRIAELAEQGQQMPPKSTYFHPKLPTGLVLKRSDDGPL